MKSPSKEIKNKVTLHTLTGLENELTCLLTHEIVEIADPLVIGFTWYLTVEPIVKHAMTFLSRCKTERC